jgi:RimJ/RimL family protein N-acetyltransferase
MNTTNGLRKGYENKEFYSLFLSKPFGPSQLGRWNNIIIYEEGDGWWNRFDVEYSFTDKLIGSAEVNWYWGNEDRTMFGQFEDSSNLQVGIKYLIE